MLSEHQHRTGLLMGGLATGVLTGIGLALGHRLAEALLPRRDAPAHRPR